VSEAAEKRRPAREAQPPRAKARFPSPAKEEHRRRSERTDIMFAADRAKE
jgi:hypothetical protein